MGKNAVEEEKLDDKVMTGEEMRNALAAMNKRRIDECTAEIEAVLRKHNCTIRATVTLPAERITIVPNTE